MPMPNALTTAQAKDDIQMICTSDMNMEQCGQCTKGKCDDPLKTLSDMCLMMDMPHCRNWRKMCDGINQNDQFKAICGSNDGPSGDDMPYMRMYFHSGMVDYVLFKEWVPRSSWQYALTWIFVMFIVMFGVFLKSCRNHYDQVQMQKSALESIEKSEDHPLIAKLSISKKQVDRNLLRAVFPKREHFKPNFIRSLFVLPIVTIDFSVMLIAMTFNIGLFIAVLVGYTIGTLLFGHGLNNIDSDLDCCNT
jgi:copper transporter 1